MKTTVPRLFALVFALLVLMTACAAPAPAPSSAGQPEPAPQSVSQPAPEPPAPASSPESAGPAAEAELPRSVQIGRPMDHHESRWAWSLEITDPAELAELAEVLSADGLTPLAKHQPRWPDGGVPVMFTLRYADRTVEGSTYPERRYRIEDEGGRATLRMGEAFYAWPGERCDRLLTFLQGKGVLTEEPVPVEDGCRAPLPQSVLLRQSALGIDRVYPYWELEITDPAELAELMGIFDTGDLTVLTEEERRGCFPDGGTPVGIRLYCADGTVVVASTFPQEGYRRDGDGCLVLGEDYYHFPADRCDALLAFLAGKKVSVVD